MPQLNRLCTVANDEKRSKILDRVPVRVTPTLSSSSLLELTQNNYILVIPAGTAYNLTPNVAFTANVMLWGAGGGSTPAAGGAGGFSTAIIRFEANVAYNVAAGSTGAGGGGGSGIEFLLNANPIIIAGGGGGGGTNVGGAGGGLFAANGTGLGATAYGASSPGTYRTGGPGSGAAFGMGYGGSGTGGGGGGMYGGALNSAGGGGGGGYLNYDVVSVSGNTITGSGVSAGNPSVSIRGNSGNTANNGLIVITLLNT